MTDSDSPSTNRSLLLTKITTTISYLLLVVTAFYYTFAAPDSRNGTFWHHNHATPFAQSKIFTSIYWLILFTLQLCYACSLFSSNRAYVCAAQATSVHYVASNLLLFGFIHLFVRNHYVLAQVLLVLNFFNLSFLYFRHSATPRFMHVGIVSGPLAWNFCALYWCGALAVTRNGIAARVVANVAIWGWAAYAVFFLVAYKDYTMGYAVGALSFSTGVGQFLTRPHLFQLQWIFAFSIGALLFLLSTAVGLPGLLGKEPFPRGAVVSEDRERAPLLADE